MSRQNDHNTASDIELKTHRHTRFVITAVNTGKYVHQEKQNQYALLTNEKSYNWRK